MKKLILPIITLLMLVLVACTEGKTESIEEQEPITPVKTAMVNKQDLVTNKEFYGRTKPDTVTPVLTPFAGEIEAVEVEKGDIVEEDDLIATLDRADRRGSIEITAPAAGEITSLMITEGAMATNTDPVAMITNLDEIKIQVNVTAGDLTLFENKKDATVMFDGVNSEKTATIDYVASVANETGLYTVELSLDNENHSVKPGMVAVVYLPEHVVKDALVIPTAALIETTDQTFVYTVKNDKAVKVDVTVLKSQTRLTAIEANLSEGDPVITDGHLTLTDGNQVRIMKEEQ